LFIGPGANVKFTNVNAGFDILRGIQGSPVMISTKITFTASTPIPFGAYQGFTFNDTSIDSLCRIRTVIFYMHIMYTMYQTPPAVLTITFSLNAAAVCSLPI